MVMGSQADCRKIAMTIEPHELAHTVLVLVLQAS